MDILGSEELVKNTLKEDLGRGDITGNLLFPPDLPAKAEIIAKDEGVIAGVDLARKVFLVVNPGVNFEYSITDGSRGRSGDIVIRLQGLARGILSGERVALNFLQHLSGVATLTSRFVEAVKPYPVKILDTRKTMPGLRLWEKYAVRLGGGINHRLGLDDGILIKDNHIRLCGGIKEAVKRIRQQAPHLMRIEVEAENLSQVKEALEAGVEIILLDNFSLKEIARAVEMVERKALLEVSGGITLANVREIAATGVNFISIGQLTHSAPALDMSLEVI